MNNAPGDALSNLMRKMEARIMADGVVDLVESGELLRGLSRLAGADGDVAAFRAELKGIRADGLVDQVESYRIANMLAALADKAATVPCPQCGRPVARRTLAGGEASCPWCGAMIVEKVGKTYLDAGDYLRDSWRLAAQVKQSGWRPDVLVALWRGGAPVGVALHEFFDAAGWSMRHFPVKCASYTGIGQNFGEVVFTEGGFDFGSLRKGEKVLVVDDVFDSGKTAVAVRDRIAPTGAEMRMACVYWKPLNNTTTMKPDYFVREANNWLVFPHEIAGLTRAEIAAKDPLLAELL